MRRYGHLTTTDLAPFFGPILEIWAQIGIKEVEGVASADVIVILLPGGAGTHVELGIALAHNKPVLIHSEQPFPFQMGPQTKPFYHHPLVTQVVSSLDKLNPLLLAFEESLKTALL